MTNRDLVDSVRSVHKLLSSDSMITDRVVLGEIKSFSQYLIRQQIEKRKLWESPNIFTTIPCLEFEEAPLAECCDYTTSTTISRSKEIIPTVNDSLFGLVIKGLYSLDGSATFIYRSGAQDYVNALKLKLRTKNVFYWLQNSRIYTSLPTLRKATFVAFFEDEVSNTLLYPDCECNNLPPGDICTNPLDRESRVPGFLSSTVKDMVAKRLLQSFFSLPTDKTSDNNDGQSK